jgi:signal transduction histidine kinase
MRLTLLYGALFTISGAILLAITYLLVSRSPKFGLIIDIQDRGPVSSATPNGGGRYLSTPPPIQPADLGRKFRELAVRQHEADLHHLLVQSGIALAIMVLISIVLGWLVAGRILRPLRTMTTTIQQISARNLHERLAAEGPRDEMKDLSDTVDGLLGRLEAALDAQKRFVANAAHELRTPLTLEHALVEETLIDRGATLQSFRSTFERVLVICKQQGRLLESLLTLASSERGLDRRESVDLSLVTEQVLLASRPELDRRELLIEADIAPAPVSGDPALVDRLVANLLDNAMDYNIPGGRVEVTTGIRAGRAVVSVANTGKDVPPEQVDRLFEPFQRLDRTAGREGHYGLGLSIVRAIATAHEASIVAHARPDGGLAVEVAFPPR